MSKRWEDALDNHVPAEDPVERLERANKLLTKQRGDLLTALKALRFHFCGSGEPVHTDAQVMSMSAAAIAKAEGADNAK